MIEYTYDGWDVIREDSSLKGVTVYQNGLGIDDKLRSKNGNVIRYFLTDHLGSTVALTDASGAITSSTSYDSFGNATSSIPTSYRYTGREYDADIGLYYYRNRWYDPELGRFISEDPIGFASGEINLYTYVHNSPLMFFDPMGMQKSHNSRRKSKKKNAPAFQKPPVRKPPEPNGCGPSDKILEYIIPDTVGGTWFWGLLDWGFFGDKYNLTPACDKHDICYSTCGKTQEQCDVQFKKDIYDECIRGGGEHSECLYYANKYELGVRKLGKGSYQDAQKDMGCIPCTSPPPPFPDIPLHLRGP